MIRVLIFIFATKAFAGASTHGGSRHADLNEDRPEARQEILHREADLGELNNLLFNINILCEMPLPPLVNGGRLGIGAQVPPMLRYVSVRVSLKEYWKKLDEAIKTSGKKLPEKEFKALKDEYLRLYQNYPVEYSDYANFEKNFQKPFWAWRESIEKVTSRLLPDRQLFVDEYSEPVEDQLERAQAVYTEMFSAIEGYCPVSLKRLQDQLLEATTKVNQLVPPFGPAAMGWVNKVAEITNRIYEINQTRSRLWELSRLRY